MSLEKTRNDIINRALSLCGAKAVGEEAADEDVSLAAGALNDMIAHWETTGVHLWRRSDFTLFTQPGQAKYQFGGSTTDHVTASFTSTTLAAALTTGDRTITLTSSTGLAVGDAIGIIISTGIYWTTVSTITPSILLADTAGVSEDVDSGTTVYYYTTDLGKALRVPDARRVYSSSEIMMTPLGRIDYLNLPNKSTSGTPVQFYYDPKVNDGYLYLWPVPTLAAEYVKGTALLPINLFDDANDDADFPDEWNRALKYNLAVDIAPDIMGGIELSRRVEARAMQYLSEVTDWDQGSGSVYFGFSKMRQGV